MSINPPKTKNKLSPLIIMASLAVVLGLIAAGGIWQYLGQTQKKVKELSATRGVVVALKEIPAGTKLTGEELTIKQLPAQTVPKDYPSSVESLKGRIVRSTVQTEEIITESRLIGEGASGGLPVVIPPDKRAITIKVNEIIGVGGFLHPGDHVDILSVVSQDKELTFSKTILQNILLLAVGDSLLDPLTVADPKAKVVSQVTVALGLNDAEKLALASQYGELQLVLRPHGDKQLAQSDGVSLQDVYGDLVMKEDQANILPVSAEVVGNEPKDVIELILGSERTYYYY